MSPAPSAQVGRAPRPSQHTVHRHKDGGELAVSLTVAPIPNGAGEPTGAVVITHDIGESQRAEAGSVRARPSTGRSTEHLPTITYVHPLGERGTPLYMSPQVDSILGYTADEWLAKPNLFFQLVHQDDRERVSAEIAAAAAGARPLRCEYRMLSRDGRVVWVHDEAVTVRDDDGRPLYVQGYLLDVSERRHAGEERERLLAAERAAAAEALDRQRKLDVLARAGEILASSPNYQATLRRVAELTVRDLADWCLVDLLDDDGAATRLAAAHSGPGVPPGDEPGPAPEPEILGVAQRGKPELSESRMCVPLRARGRMLGALTLLTRAPGRSYGADDLAVAQDLAGMTALAVDNARLTREVEESADAARVLTYVADGVVLVDQTGTIRLWNPAAEAITGLARRRGAGPRSRRRDRRLEGGRRPDPRRDGRRIRPAQDVPAGNRAGRAVDLHLRRRLLRRHRLRLPRRHRRAPARGAEGGFRRHGLPRAAHAARRRLRRRADAAPPRLRPRRGRAQPLRLADRGRVRAPEPHRQRDPPRQPARRRAASTSSMSPSTPAISSSASSSPRASTAPPGSASRRSSPSPTPPVAADRDRVRQVLVNLVENAIKYSPDGGLIQVGVQPAEGAVCFYVRDEGLGIPADEQARIFEKFYRLDPEMTRGVGGTGLGLYICSELLERMDGRIWVESQEGSARPSPSSSPRPSRRLPGRLRRRARGPLRRARPPAHGRRQGND